jgi:hypothetical protein
VLDPIDTIDTLDVPAPRRRWWMAGGLTLAAVALLAGLVAVLARDDDPDDRPVSAPELRWLVGDESFTSFGALEQRLRASGDMWPEEGPVKYALYGSHDDPSQPTISLAVGDYVNADGFAFVNSVEDLRRATVDGVEAQCATWVYGFQLCMADVRGTFVQAHARGLTTDELVDLLLHATVQDGRPVLDDARLPVGMSLLDSWDDRPPGSISRIDASAITTSVGFGRPDGVSAGLAVGWADQQELAAAFESSDYTPTVEHGITFYVSTEPVFGGSHVVWEQDGRAFDLSVKGSPDEALALARTAHPATDAEWAAAVVAEMPPTPIATTTVAPVST